MDCEKVREQLPFYGDSSLEPTMETNVRKHLDVCTDCKREYEEIRSVTGMVREVFLENAGETPPDFLGNVRNRIHEKKRARMTMFRVTTAAAVVVMTVTAFLYGYLKFDGTIDSTELAEMVDYQIEDSVEGLLASSDLDIYDMNELLDSGEETDSDDELFDVVIGAGMDDLSPGDIMNILDEDEVVLVLASY